LSQTCFKVARSRQLSQPQLGHASIKSYTYTRSYVCFGFYKDKTQAGIANMNILYSNMALNLIARYPGA